MDGGAYAPIVSRILKSGRRIGSDAGKVAQERLEVKLVSVARNFGWTDWRVASVLRRKK